MVFKNILWVGIGGAAGSICRYLTQRALLKVFPHAFPVNIAGCFLIGLLFGAANRMDYFSPTFRLLLMTGFCGGFTTFSAFTLEGMELYNQQKFLIFTLYFTCSVVFGLLATFAGAWLTQNAFKPI
jgi:fluoride exporter